MDKAVLKVFWRDFMTGQAILERVSQVNELVSGNELPGGIGPRDLAQAAQKASHIDPRTIGESISNVKDSQLVREIVPSVVQDIQDIKVDDLLRFGHAGFEELTKRFGPAAKGFVERELQSFKDAFSNFEKNFQNGANPFESLYKSLVELNKTTSGSFVLGLLGAGDLLDVIEGGKRQDWGQFAGGVFGLVVTAATLGGGNAVKAALKTGFKQVAQKAAVQVSEEITTNLVTKYGVEVGKEMGDKLLVSIAKELGKDISEQNVEKVARKQIGDLLKFDSPEFRKNIVAGLDKLAAKENGMPPEVLSRYLGDKKYAEALADEVAKQARDKVETDIIKKLELTPEGLAKLVNDERKKAGLAALTQVEKEGIAKGFEAGKKKALDDFEAAIRKETLAGIEEFRSKHKDDDDEERGRRARALDVKLVESVKFETIGLEVVPDNDEGLSKPVRGEKQEVSQYNPNSREELERQRRLLESYYQESEPKAPVTPQAGRSPTLAMSKK
jgi:hypothetical protein